MELLWSAPFYHGVYFATPLVPLTCAAPITDYDSLRQQAKSMRISKITEVRQLISKLQKAQHAGEDALDLYASAEHDTI